MPLLPCYYFVVHFSFFFFFFKYYLAVVGVISIANCSDQVRLLMQLVQYTQCIACDTANFGICAHPLHARGYFAVSRALTLRVNVRR